MKGIHLIFDGNATAYRANIVTELCTKQGFRTSAIMGTLNITHSTAETVKKEYNLPIKEIVYAWDKGHSPRRTKLYPQYKAHRKQSWTPEDEQWHQELYQQIDILNENFPNLGIKSLAKKGWEGDDLIWGFINVIEKDFPEDLVVIASTDEDFHQLLDTRVHIYSPIKKVFLNPSNYLEIKGIAPESFMTYKILQGDSSDNIPGIPGIGEKTAKSLVNTYKTLDILLDHREELSHSKRTAKIFTVEGLKILDRNNQLINLKEYVDLQPVLGEIRQLVDSPVTIDLKAVKQFFTTYQLVSLLVKFREWTILFEDIATGYFEEIL